MFPLLGKDTKLCTYVHLVLKLRMGGALPLLSQMTLWYAHQQLYLQFMMKQGCPNSGCQETKFCIVATNIFSIIIAVFSLNTKMDITTCTRQKVPDNDEIYRPPRTVGPQCGTCILSPFWHLEIGGGSEIFGKSGDCWNEVTDSRCSAT